MPIDQYFTSCELLFEILYPKSVLMRKWKGADESVGLEKMANDEWRMANPEEEELIWADL